MRLSKATVQARVRNAGGALADRALYDEIHRTTIWKIPYLCVHCGERSEVNIKRITKSKAVCHHCNLVHRPPRRLPRKEAVNRLINAGMSAGTVEASLVKTTGRRTWLVIGCCLDCGVQVSPTLREVEDRVLRVDGLLCRTCSVTRAKTGVPNTGAGKALTKSYEDAAASFLRETGNKAELLQPYTKTSERVRARCVECGQTWSYNTYHTARNAVVRGVAKCACNPTFVRTAGKPAPSYNIRLSTKVYVVSLSVRDRAAACKIGITNADTQFRFRQLPSYVTFEELYIHEFGEGQALEVERQLHQQFREHKLPNWVVPLNEGHTELFDLAAAPDIIQAARALQ